MKKPTLVINLFGGPGTGKSTTMAGVFSYLKLKGVNCEQVTEYAKDLVWQESFGVLENQVYLFGKQYHRLFRVMDKVDCIVTDSPILLSLIYNKQSIALPSLVLECHHKMFTMNVMLGRVKEYNPAGRYQTEDEAKSLDTVIRNMLDLHGIKYVEVAADESAPEFISKIAIELMNMAEEASWL